MWAYVLYLLFNSFFEQYICSIYKILVHRYCERKNLVFHLRQFEKSFSRVACEWLLLSDSAGEEERTLLANMCMVLSTHQAHSVCFSCINSCTLTFMNYELGAILSLITDEKTESQRCWVLCSRSHSSKVAELSSRVHALIWGT